MICRSNFQMNTKTKVQVKAMQSGNHVLAIGDCAEDDPYVPGEITLFASDAQLELIAAAIKAHLERPDRVSNPPERYPAP